MRKLDAADPPRRRRCCSAIAALHLDRAAHRIDDAGKLHQQAVAGGLDDAAVMLGDLRIEELAAQRFEAFERAFLVRPHQPAVTGDVRRKDCSEPAFDPLSAQDFPPAGELRPAAAPRPPSCQLAPAGAALQGLSWA